MGLKEFQPLIMAAGKGSRMTELTLKRPKCLLPIGNLPMVWYPIRLLERSGFQDVIVVVHEAVKSEVQNSLEHTGLKIHIEIMGIAVEEDWGTADTLRFLYESNKIKSDLLVLSCDLVSNIDLTGVLNQFRQHDASLVTLFCHPTAPKVNLPTPGPKSKNKTERDLVAIDPATSRLVFLASASDYEETVSFTRGLIKKHGRVRLFSRLLDAHVYVMKRWLCQYLTLNRNMSTLKGELIPYTVKKQYSRPASALDKAASVVPKPKAELIDLAVETELAVKIRGISNFSDHCGDEFGAYHGDAVRCFATVAPDTVFAARANTLQDYCRINREIVERWKDVCGTPLTHIGLNTTVLSTQLDLESCLVAEGAAVSERTAVKASLLGAHSSVKPRTRIFNCILMSGAKIGEGCALVNCIICEEAVVEDNCELKDCLVGSCYTVPTREKRSCEVLADDGHLIEIV